MNTSQRVSLIVATGIVTFVVSALLMMALAQSFELIPGDAPDWAVPLSLLGLIAVPFACGLGAARFVSRKWLSLPEETTGTTKRARAAIWVTVVAYALTAVFGSPAAQSAHTTWAVSEYKRVKASGSPRVWDAHPYIHTYAAIPVAPGLILSYHEYQLDGLYGFGGFDLSLWYAVVVRPIVDFALWVS